MQYCTLVWHMFFSRRGPEEVRADELAKFLNSQFEKKLGSFGSRAGEITRSVGQALSRFGEAGDRFDKLEAEPYMERRYSTNANTNSVKAQKSRYSLGLKQILGRVRLEAEASNSYEKYQEILSSLEGMRKEIMEANSNFKNVLYCYSNHLWDFKSAFSEAERLIGNL